MQPTLDVHCPDYDVKLTAVDGTLSCPNTTCPSRKGCIFIDDAKNDFYWGEVSREEMERVNGIVETQGYEACKRYILENHPKLAGYLLSDQRIDWLWSGISPGRTSTCLDIGSGWGVTTSLLASVYKEVWSFEGVKERLNFQILKNKAVGIDNVNYVHGLLPRLPFPDNSFDLVTLNGVLEWAGLFDKSISVRQNQKNLLQECMRVLSPGGVVYVGIENRIAQSCIRGGLDHSGLPYTSLMPRWLADVTVKRHNRRQSDYDERIRSVENIDGYRTYTYTASGYKELMAESGYAETKINWVHPSYNTPRFVGPFEGDSFKHFFRDSPVTFGPATGHKLNNLAKLPVVGSNLRSFANSFVIFGWKGKKEQTWEEMMFDGSDSIYRESARGKVIYYQWDKDKYEVVMADRKLLSDMSNASADDLPRSPFVNQDPCYLYSVEDNQSCLNWLKDYQAKHLTSRTPEDIEAEIDSVYASANTCYGAELANELIANIDRERLVALLSRNDLHAHEHGDFWFGNILKDDKGNLTVIDFEHHREQGDRLFDVSYFAIRNCRTGKGAQKSIFLQNMRGNGLYSDVMTKVVQPFLDDLKVSRDEWMLYAPYCILRVITREEPDSGHWQWQKNYTDLIELLRSFKKDFA